jgi:kelch-like protein 2/3
MLGGILNASRINIHGKFFCFRNEVLCDIKLQTDDGTVLCAHKLVLVSVSPYFQAMFTRFNESNKDIVNIRYLDSTVLQLLLDYIYTGEIMISKKNVQV